ncbi:MAG: hypothetical protein GY820_07380 [Gammaproteobacteria bacterium]|nr:hypothetical protein [Gammaproteobacteria bacterium]
MAHKRTIIVNSVKGMLAATQCAQEETRNERNEEKGGTDRSSEAHTPPTRSLSISQTTYVSAPLQFLLACESCRSR